MFTQRVKLLILSIIAIFLMGCIGGTRGNGTVENESRSVSQFTEIRLQTVGEVQLSQAETTTLTIEAEENLLPLIETVVDGDSLIIRTQRGRNITPTEPIIIRLSTPTLNKITISGSGTVNANDIGTEVLDIAVSGSGDVRIDALEGDRVKSTISGSGDISLSGDVSEQEVQITGSGDFSAVELLSNTAVVTITGSGNATVFATSSLDASITGSGNITFYGDPAVKRAISGSGDIEAGSGR